MKRIIVFLSFFVTVFAVVFLLSLLLPSKITVAKSVEINATVETVKQQIIDFNNWKNWYPAFSDNNFTVVKNSTSNNQLVSVTLTDIRGKKITLIQADTTEGKVTIKVQSSSSSKVDYQFILIPKTNRQTELIWNVNTYLGWYPWKRIQGIFLDKFSGEQYVAVLRDLKVAAEH